MLAVVAGVLGDALRQHAHTAAPQRADALMVGTGLNQMPSQAQDMVAALGAVGGGLDIEQGFEPVNRLGEPLQQMRHRHG